MGSMLMPLPCSHYSPCSPHDLYMVRDGLQDHVWEVHALADHDNP